MELVLGHYMMAPGHYMMELEHYMMELEHYKMEQVGLHTLLERCSYRSQCRTTFPECRPD